MRSFLFVARIPFLSVYLLHPALRHCSSLLVAKTKSSDPNSIEVHMEKPFTWQIFNCFPFAFPRLLFAHFMNDDDERPFFLEESHMIFRASMHIKTHSHHKKFAVSDHVLEKESENKNINCLSFFPHKPQFKINFS